MRVLITGGFGYVGGRLAQYLATHGDHDIVLGTRREAPVPGWSPRARVMRMQWDSEESIRTACSGADAVIHLAGMNAQECRADPVKALAVNGVATTRLVLAAVECGVRRFIHVSTAHVYGNPLAGTISEDTCTLAVHPYATSHRAGEDAVLLANLDGKLEGIVVRLSNSYGPPVHAGVDCWMLLVNDLCRQAVSERRIQLQSAGLQRRDFITLADACRGIALLLQMPATTSRFGIFNAGGEWAPSVFEMAQRIAACSRDALGYSPELLRPAPPAEAQTPLLDYRIDRLRAAGFVPEGAIDDEITATLAFCVASRSALHGTS
ncbi:MAG: SDR family oxidoreductase [Pseudomonadota bacterium]